MTERERLIELIDNGLDKYRVEPLINGCRESFDTFIAGYLLANGVIVPPCKVGDTVYVCFSRTRVIECKVARITRENIEEIGISFICYGGMHFDMRHWCKTVFLTREEAEKALEGKT
jgi:hypothetical protein